MEKLEAEMVVLTNKVEAMKAEETKERKSSADELIIQELKVRVVIRVPSVLV